MTYKWWKAVIIIGIMTAITGNTINTTTARFQTNVENSAVARTAAFALDMVSPDGTEPVSLICFDSPDDVQEYPFLVRNHGEVSVSCNLSCDPADFTVQFTPSSFTLEAGETKLVEAVITPATGSPATVQTEIVLKATQIN